MGAVAWKLSLSDVYNMFASGQLANSNYPTRRVQYWFVWAGKKRHDLIRVSNSAEVGEVVCL